MSKVYIRLDVDTKSIRRTNNYEETSNVLHDVEVFLDVPEKYTYHQYDDYCLLQANVEVGDELFVVIENHEDGSTFSHCDEAFTVSALFTKLDEAEKFCNDEKNVTNHHFQRHNEWLIAKRTVTEKAIRYCDNDKVSRYRFI